MFTLQAEDFFLSRKNAVRIEERSPQESFPEHDHHDFDELVIVQNGFGSHVINDVQSTLSSGSVLFIKQEDRHLFENVEDLVLTNVLYKPVSGFQLDTLQQRLVGNSKSPNRVQSIQVGHKTLKDTGNLINQITQEGQKTDAVSDIMAQTLLIQLVIVLIRGTIPNPKDAVGTDDKVLSILKYMQENYVKDINLELLADDYNLTLKTMSRLVKKFSGMTPGQYLNRIRLCYAMHMLQRTTKSITEIAYLAGFNDSNYFSCKFHKVIGMTPQQYRHKHWNPRL